MRWWLPPDGVEVLFIGGGFSALLISARLREKGVESIRIVERGADVGGTWYCNRYPGVACDVVAYDYLPLLDELNYVPNRHYAEGPEIFAHCQAIANKYDLYDLAVFQTTVTSTVWDAEAQRWNVTTDRGDRMHAEYVVCANGTLAKPRLPRIDGMETFKGHSFHTSRWDYDFTGDDLEKLGDVRVGIIGTGAHHRSTSATTGKRKTSGRPSSNKGGRPSAGPRSSPNNEHRPNARDSSAAASPRKRRFVAKRTTTSIT